MEAALGAGRHLDNSGGGRLLVYAPLVLAVLQLLLLYPYRNFAGDDAYITFRFVESVLAGDGFSFNRGEPTYASTAPLWVLMIAAVAKTGLDVNHAAHLLNWVFSLANVFLFWSIATRFLGHNRYAVMAGVLFIADPWLVRWGLSGMENSFALFLLMGSFWFQLRRREQQQVNLVTPVLAGLAVLCRPEMALWGALLGLDGLINDRGRRRLQNAVALSLIGTAVVLPWLIYAQLSFGSIIPNTITAKISGDHLLAATRTAQYFGSFWAFQAVVLAVLLLRAPSTWLAKALRPQAWHPWFLPITWSLVLPAFYITGGAPVAGRYLMFGLPFYLLIGVWAWRAVLGARPPAVMAAFVASLALLAFVQYRYCWYVTKWPQGMDPKMIALAETLRGIAKPEETVAGDQIGVLAYFSGIRVLDTYGLASKEVLAVRNPADPFANLRYAADRKVEYLFLTDEADSLAARDPRYASIELVRAEDVQREGAGAAGTTIRYHLYRTNW